MHLDLILCFFILVLCAVIGLFGVFLVADSIVGWIKNRLNERG
jgi:hypothetical protein